MFLHKYLTYVIFFHFKFTTSSPNIETFMIYNLLENDIKPAFGKLCIFSVASFPKGFVQMTLRIISLFYRVTLTCRYKCTLFLRFKISRLELQCIKTRLSHVIPKLTFKSPEMLAPASTPVAAGKKMANTEKKLCSSVK